MSHFFIYGEAKIFILREKKGEQGKRTEPFLSRIISPLQTTTGVRWSKIEAWLCILFFFYYFYVSVSFSEIDNKEIIFASTSKQNSFVQLIFTSEIKTRNV